MTETGADESLFPIAVLIDELRHEDVQVRFRLIIIFNLDNNRYFFCFLASVK